MWVSAEGVEGAALQRPWGSPACCAGGSERSLCGWSTGKRGGEEGGSGGTGQVVQGPLGHREDLTLTLREMGAMEGCGPRRRDLALVLRVTFWSF